MANCFDVYMLLSHIHIWFEGRVGKGLSRRIISSMSNAVPVGRVEGGKHPGDWVWGWGMAQ